MYKRLKKTSNGNIAVQIIEQVKIKGTNKFKQQINHIGTAKTKEDLKLLEKKADLILQKNILGNDSKELISKADDLRTAKELINKLQLVSPKNLKKIRTYAEGVDQIFGSIYDELHYNKIIDTSKKDDLYNTILKYLTLVRIDKPSSKRKTVEILNEDYNMDITVKQVYSMMDHLYQKEEQIKQLVSVNTRKLLNTKVSVLFFDVTTLYFESFIQEGLKQPGFSKDGKFKEDQVVLSLIVTQEGLPITYEVFPGNTYEGSTLLVSAKVLREKYNIDKIILVADRGMFNEDNLKLMDDNNIDYVVGAKLKTLPETMKQRIIEDKDYHIEMIGDEIHWVKEYEYKGRRLVSGFSKNRAKKDSKDRLRLIERLERKIKGDKISIKELIPNYGTKKYIKVVDKSQATIKVERDNDKINEDSKWDGVYGVITSLRNKPINEIIARYRELWQVEESFRINKHDLKMRPIFHWKEERIRAHLSICFLAYSVARTVEYKLKQAQFKLSIDNIKTELRKMDGTILKDISTNREIYIPAMKNETQRTIYKILGMEQKE